jgi:hypothetical protein
MREDRISDIDLDNKFIRMTLAATKAELDLRVAAAAAIALASSASVRAPSKGKGDMNDKCDNDGKTVLRMSPLSLSPKVLAAACAASGKPKAVATARALIGDWCYPAHE